MGVLIGARGRFPRVGRGESEEVEGRVTASWLVDRLNIPPQSDMGIFLHVASRTSAPSLVQIHTEVRSSVHKGGWPANLLGPLDLGLGPWTSLGVYKPVVARLLVLDNIFSIFSLKSSKSQSKFLQWINTKTVELDYNKGFEHSHFLNITDMLAHEIGGLQPSTTNHKCTQTCLYRYFILNRGLGSCPGAVARLWGWNLGRPLPRSSLWNPTSRIISVV
jgi:hypothetical protein